MPSQRGGGSIGQSLKYVDPAAPERSAPAGSDLLKESGLIARPAIGGGTRKRKGGFYPSVMSGVVNAGVVLAPLTAMAARKLFTRKHRKGGGKKANMLQAEKEEAKRILEGMGKPSAANVLAYVKAKRMGSAAGEEYLSSFRKKKQEKNEANEAKRRAKENTKAAKAAERAATRDAKKAAKEAERAAMREAKRASKKVKKAAAAEKPPSAVSSTSTASTRSRSRSNASSNSERAPTQAQLRREAEENAARARAEAKAAAKKPLKNSQVAWFSLIENAAKRLATNGVPTRKNAMKYASLLKKGKTDEAESFLANFRARSRKSNKKPAVAVPTVAAPSAAAASAAPKSSGNNGAAASAAVTKKKKKTATAAPSGNGTAKPRKSPSAASKKYFDELRKAREYLGTIGAPTGPNMSKFASMKLKGENTSSWEQNFRTRRPLSMASSKKAKKPAKPATPKPLTAVNEGNENNMQGYSENFESESSNE
jgi:hypothetical protein